TIIVRGTAATRYTVCRSFFAPTPNKTTETISHISLLILSAINGTTTCFRQCVRRNGQNYRILGLETGRRNFGFNVARFSQEIKVVNDSMRELNNTGSISENKPLAPQR